MRWTIREFFILCALSTSILGSTAEVSACDERVTIYLDRSISMLGDNSDSSPFAKSIEAINTIFLGSKQNDKEPFDKEPFHIILKTFGEKVDETTAIDEDLADDIDRERFRSKLGGLRGIRNNKGTDISNVVQDILETNSNDEREIFIIISDFIHDIEPNTIPPTPATPEDWEVSLIQRLNKKSRDEAIEAIRTFLAAKGKTRNLFLLVGRIDEKRWDVAHRVLTDLGDSDTLRVHSFAVSQITQDQNNGTLLAALKPVSIEIKRSPERSGLRVMLQKQSCRNNVVVDKIRFKGQNFEDLDVDCNLTLASARSTPCPEIIQFGKFKINLPSLGGNDSGFAYAMHDKRPISGLEEFRFDSFIELSKAEASVNAGSIKITPWVSGQPPFDSLFLTGYSGSKEVAKSEDLVKRLPNDEVDDMKHNIPQEWKPIDLVTELSHVNLCGHTEGDISIALEGMIGGHKVASRRLPMKLRKSSQHDSHEFFDHAAIPGMGFLFIVILFLVATSNPSLRRLAELSEVTLLIVGVTFAILNDVTPVGDKAEQIVARHSEVFADLCLSLLWILVLVCIWRKTFDEEHEMADYEGIFLAQRLSKVINTYYRMRLCLSIASCVFLVILILTIRATNEPIDKCTYMSNLGNRFLTTAAGTDKG